MLILAIDPGPEVSAWVLYDSETRRIVEFSNEQTNEDLLRRMRGVSWLDHRTRIAIEMIASYGMPVGMSTFETCVHIGRMVEARTPAVDYDWRVYRTEVKSAICHDGRAKDANIRQALLDRFPKGTKKEPGPSYGLSGDGWAALAVAVTVAEGGVRHKSLGEQKAAQAVRRQKKADKRAAAKAQADLLDRPRPLGD